VYNFLRENKLPETTEIFLKENLLRNSSDIQREIPIKSSNPFLYEYWKVFSYLYFKQLLEFFNLDFDIEDNILVSVTNPKLYKDIINFISESSAYDLIYFIEWYIINMKIFKNFISKDIIDAYLELISKISETFDEIFINVDLNNDIYVTDIVDDMDEFSPISYLEKSKISKYLRKREIEQEDENVDEQNNCFVKVNNIMPLAISKLYINSIDKNNYSTIKNEIKDMVENIKESMIKRIPEMEWLDEETKQYALEKTLKIKDIIGYQEDIMDSKKIYENYEKVKIDNYFSFIINEEVSDLGNKLKLLNKNDISNVSEYIILIMVLLDLSLVMN